MKTWLKDRWRYWFGVRYYYEPERLWTRWQTARIMAAYEINKEKES